NATYRNTSDELGSWRSELQVGSRYATPTPHREDPTQSYKRAFSSSGPARTLRPVASYEIPLDQRTVHGHFSRELEPILTIESGDAISFATLDAGWGRGPPPPDVGERWQLQPRESERDSEGRPIGHALVGPIAVRGARPGAVLEVWIDEVRAGNWGWTWAG